MSVLGKPFPDHSFAKSRHEVFAGRLKIWRMGLGIFFAGPNRPDLSRNGLAKEAKEEASQGISFAPFKSFARQFLFQAQLVSSLSNLARAGIRMSEHGEMPQKIAQRHHRPAGEFKFVDHHSISISPCSPSKLGGLCKKIDRRNSGLFRATSSLVVTARKIIAALVRL